MLTNEAVQIYNSILLQKLSVFLNVEPDFITKDIIDELTGECNLSVADAYATVLAAAIGLDVEHNQADKGIFRRYFPEMIHPLDAKEYTNNPYYKNIRIPQVKSGKWELSEKSFEPYEAFVCNDIETRADGRMIPQIGFFTEKFKYPVALESGREWMLITPNETETMKEPVAKARGNVLTYGLGLGYFAYMASQKEDVVSLAVVEKEQTVIDLFEKHILPQFPHKEKIEIIRADAFEFAKHKVTAGKYDFIFADIWHDASDGVAAYKKLKPLERYSPLSEYCYWIEKTLKCYL